MERHLCCRQSFRVKDISFLAIINDEREITVILKEYDLKNLKPLAVERGFRLLTFDITLLFNLAGFIAKIALAMAKENTPILVISSFSTDHILVRETDIKEAVRVLTDIGFDVTET